MAVVLFNLCNIGVERCEIDCIPIRNEHWVPVVVSMKRYVAFSCQRNKSWRLMFVCFMSILVLRFHICHQGSSRWKRRKHTHTQGEVCSCSSVHPTLSPACCHWASLWVINGGGENASKKGMTAIFTIASTWMESWQETNPTNEFGVLVSFFLLLLLFLSSMRWTFLLRENVFRILSLLLEFGKMEWWFRSALVTIDCCRAQ